jgi:hypothetical protein
MPDVKSVTALATEAIDQAFQNQMRETFVAAFKHTERDDVAGTREVIRKGFLTAQRTRTEMLTYLGINP